MAFFEDIPYDIEFKKGGSMSSNMADFILGFMINRHNRKLMEAELKAKKAQAESRKAKAEEFNRKRDSEYEYRIRNMNPDIEVKVFNREENFTM